jgi:hypothetical protein
MIEVYVGGGEFEGGITNTYVSTYDGSYLRTQMSDGEHPTVVLYPQFGSHI